MELLASLQEQDLGVTSSAESISTNLVFISSTTRVRLRTVLSFPRHATPRRNQMMDSPPRAASCSSGEMPRYNDNRKRNEVQREQVESRTERTYRVAIGTESVHIVRAHPRAFGEGKI